MPHNYLSRRRKESIIIAGILNGRGSSLFIMIIVLMASDCNVYYIYLTSYFYAVVGSNNEVSLTNERNFDITKISQKKSTKTSLFRATTLHLVIVCLVCRTNCSTVRGPL